MTAKKATTMGAICSLFCCVICCGIPGVAALIILNNTVGEWPAVDGTVVSTRICDIATTDNRENDQTYYVTYNYTIADGTAITSETSYCSNPYPKVGETVSITYDPANPEDIVEEQLVHIGLTAAKTATGIGFGLGALAFCVAVVMCMQPDPPANPTTYQNNTHNNEYDNTYNDQYGNEPSSVPVSGPAGDIPTPTATAVPMAPAVPAPAAPMAPAVVYNGGTTPSKSGPVTYYK